MTDYRTKWVRPIHAEFRNHTLWTIPAPASGAIWLSAMGILDQFEAAPQGSVLDYHRVTEVLRVSDPLLTTPLAHPCQILVYSTTVSSRYISYSGTMQGT